LTFLLNYTEDDPSLPAPEMDLDQQANFINRRWAGNPMENNGLSLIETENNLRFAIGRYIHDNPQQQLQAAISLLREQAELFQLAPDKAQAQQSIINQKVLSLLNRADQELNLLRREVLPADPRAGTLKMSLETYLLEDFPGTHPDASFKLSYQLDELAEVFDCRKNSYIPEKMLVSLFVREALRNVYKHARARRVEIDSKVVVWSGKQESCGELERVPDDGYYLRLSVKDNGRGFEPGCLQKRIRHSSFYDFETRASMLGGFSRLISAPGLGTLWEMYLPLPGESQKSEARSQKDDFSVILNFGRARGE
jgi:signal transduction histidine kinase